MTRIGKKPVEIPNGTTVTVEDGLVTVKGPKGELARKFNTEISINVGEDAVTLEPTKKDGSLGALWGTYASHISNMIQGVNEPFVKKLIVEGVGFKTELKGEELSMNLGFSHPVVLQIPEGLSVEVEKELITISGIDKELVGHFAANVRVQKKPEPYKGKGIRYEGEIIRRKQGKKAVAG